nr:hypothetical protein [Agromyces archimandritae]
MTPGVVGFIVTFLIAIVVVLLIIDMVRRIRRTNYRAEVRERLAAEAAARDDELGAGDGQAVDAGEAPGPGADAPARPDEPGEAGPAEGPTGR